MVLATDVACLWMNDVIGVRRRSSHLRQYVTVLPWDTLVKSVWIIRAWSILDRVDTYLEANKENAGHQGNISCRLAPLTDWIPNESDRLDVLLKGKPVIAFGHI